jgi:hypothetical protein
MDAIAPSFPETVVRERCQFGGGLLMAAICLLILDRRNMPNRFEKAAVVKPRDPF